MIKQTLYELYSPIDPYASGYLDVDDTHSLYWEQCGNPGGVPIVFLHGGPGAGCSPIHRRFFDPDRYRIIIFDQRGAGKSTPLGALKNNTTADLVDDIERLRKHLDIKAWHIFGGSWGSTLALCYAQNHPEACLSLILRGIFLCTQEEIDWFLYGIETVFPDHWTNFAHYIPAEERHDLLRAYYKRLTADDPETVQNTARQWATYEAACATLLPGDQQKDAYTQTQIDHDLAISRIEAHYFIHEVIPPAESLLKHIDVIRHIPATIIQGRYDMICPVKSAYKLHQAWPEANLTIIPNGGHSALDPAIRSALIQACKIHLDLKEQ